MKIRTISISDLLAEAALAETERPDLREFTGSARTFARQMEQRFIEVAFAEAADYGDIERSLLRDLSNVPSWPEECQFGDNDACFPAG